MMRAPRAASRAAAAAAATAVLGVLAAAPAHAATAVAVWHMGDAGTSGTTMLDASGHRHHGTLHGVTTGQPGVSGGKGYGFSQAPAYITVPSATDLNPGSSSFSFTVNVRYPARPSATVGDYDLLRKGLASTPGGDYKVEVLRGGQAYCEFRGSSGVVGVTSRSTMPTGAWHRITCARTSASVTVTVDGAATTRSGSTGTISNTGSVYLGARDSTGGDQYTGLLDDVSITRG